MLCITVIEVNIGGAQQEVLAMEDFAGVAVTADLIALISDCCQSLNKLRARD